jgi:hypothetical protein
MTLMLFSRAILEENLQQKNLMTLSLYSLKQWAIAFLGTVPGERGEDSEYELLPGLAGEYAEQSGDGVDGQPSRGQRLGQRVLHAQLGDQVHSKYLHNLMVAVVTSH